MSGVQCNHLATAMGLLFLVVTACGNSSTAAREVPDPDLQHQNEASVIEAMHAARERVRAAPDDADTWGRYGDLLGVYGYERSAAECYSAAAALQPDEFRWPYMRALTLVMLEPEQAFLQFERAIEIDPDYAPARIKAGNLAIDLDRKDRAEAHLERALELDADEVEAELAMGRLRFGAGELESAREHLARAASLDPTHPDVHEVLSRLCFRMGEADTARSHAEQARRLARKTVISDPRGQPQIEPISSLDFFKYGLDLVGRGQLDEARQKFLQALERNPDLHEARFNLALTLATVGEHDGAVAEFQEILRRRPDHVDSLVRLGALQGGMGRVQEARAALERVVALEPERAEGHFHLGQLYESNAKLPAAVGYYAKAVELDGEVSEYRARLATTLAVTGQHAAAAEQWQQWCERNPDRLDGKVQWATALGNGGKLREALEVWETLCSQEPERGEFQRGRQSAVRVLAAQLALEQDTAGAVEMLNALLDERPTWAPALRTLAWILATTTDAELHDPVRALALAESALEHAGREDAGSLDTLAVALAVNGQFDEAVETAERARTLADARPDQAARIEERLELFRQGKPYRAGAVDGGGE